MEEEIRLVNGRLFDEVVQNHALWMEDESSGFRCVLDRETLNEAILPGLHLQGAIIRGTGFVDADLSGGDWSRATIEDANLTASGPIAYRPSR